MHRRSFLKGASAACLGGLLAGCDLKLSDGVYNPCEPLQDLDPEQREIFGEALDGIDFSRLWDVHVHLIGNGAGGSGIWLNPRFKQFWRPGWNIRYKSYLDAACLGDAEEAAVDRGYVEQLLQLQAQLPTGSKLMLLAFDYRYDKHGQRDLERSVFHIPNAYAARIAARHPQRFEWIASIHPYRADCLESLDLAVARGARAVKWLPQAMGMDPASPLCDPFYERAAALGIPLLIHTGGEDAMPVPDQEPGNPLRLRRPLEHGVRVIAAHCAREGEGVDLDRGPHGPKRRNFELFSRLMETPAYEGLLLGDVSALFITVHDKEPARQVLERRDWHPRLLYGSDYPLPAILPLFDNEYYVEAGLLQAHQAQALIAVRRYNPLLYNLLLTRLARADGKGLPPGVFHTRDHLLARAP